MRHLLLAVFYVLTVSCFEQYNPFPYRKQLQQERLAAHQAIPTLTEDGSLPQAKPVGEVAQLSEIDQAYNNFCVSCHGADGKAETDAAKGLSPRPRNFTDSEWQASRTDQQIRDVIEKGGKAALGRDSAMAPWAAMLPGALLDQMVTKVRSFKAQ